MAYNKFVFPGKYSWKEGWKILITLSILAQVTAGTEKDYDIAPKAEYDDNDADGHKIKGSAHQYYQEYPEIKYMVFQEKSSTDDDYMLPITEPPKRQIKLGKTRLKPPNKESEQFKLTPADVKTKNFHESDSEPLHEEYNMNGPVKNRRERWESKKFEPNPLSAEEENYDYNSVKLQDGIPKDKNSDEYSYSDENEDDLIDSKQTLKYIKQNLDTSPYYAAMHGTQQTAAVAKLKITTMEVISNSTNQPTSMNESSSSSFEIIPLGHSSNEESEGLVIDIDPELRTHPAPYSESTTIQLNDVVRVAPVRSISGAVNTLQEHLQKKRERKRKNIETFFETTTTNFLDDYETNNFVPSKLKQSSNLISSTNEKVLETTTIKKSIIEITFKTTDTPKSVFFSSEMTATTTLPSTMKNLPMFGPIAIGHQLEWRNFLANNSSQSASSSMCILAVAIFWKLYLSLYP